MTDDEIRDHIAKMDTLRAMELLTATLELVVGNADQDNGEFEMLESYELNRYDRANNWVSPFTIMDSVTADLRSWRDDPEYPGGDDTSHAAVSNEAESDHRAAQMGGAA